MPRWGQTLVSSQGFLLVEAQATQMSEEMPGELGHIRGMSC